MSDETSWKNIFKKYWLELIILFIAVLIASISAIIYIKSSRENNQLLDLSQPTILQNNDKSDKIYVEVSGSVNKPDLYEASNNTRLKDFIKKAGGLSETADRDFFGRNFNLARVVADQEKIYIPSIWEVSNGYFIENPQAFSQTSSISNQQSVINNSLININTATIEELDTLSGVGKVTGQKIIDNRPFKALQELIDKKIVNKTVFENIKNLIEI